MIAKPFENAIRDLAQRHGEKLTPSIVVDAARSKDSPLHECFDWDDETAGEKWRLQQARDLIRRVTIEVTTEAFTIQAPAYVRDPEVAADEQGYISVVALRSDADLAREAIVAEFSRAEAALQRAKAVAAALNISTQDEIEAIRAKIVGFSQGFQEQRIGVRTRASHQQAGDHA